MTSMAFWVDGAADCAVVRFGGAPRPAIWRAWLLLVLPPLLLFTLTTVWAILAVVQAHGDRSVIGPSIQRAVPYIVLVNHALLYLLLLWFMRLDRLSARDIGWPLPSPGLPAILREVAIGLAAGGVLWLIHEQILTPFGSWLAGDALRAASRSAPLGGNVAMALFAGIVLGGFVEEQLYRGYVLVRLSERMSVWAAMVPMLFFFGLLHFGLGISGMLVATLTGLNLTLLFVWRRSLISAVLAHALINALVILF